MTTTSKTLGYQFAILPLYYGKDTSTTIDSIQVTPEPLQNGTVLTSLTTYNVKILFAPVVVGAIVDDDVSCKWVVTYGDPYLDPANFSESNVIAYGETKNFNFTIDDSLRNVFIRIDMSQPSSSPEGVTTLSRLFKFRTVTNGENEKIRYALLFVFVLALILLTFGAVYFHYHQNKRFVSNEYVLRTSPEFFPLNEYYTNF